MNSQKYKNEICALKYNLENPNPMLAGRDPLLKTF